MLLLLALTASLALRLALRRRLATLPVLLAALLFLLAPGLIPLVNFVSTYAYWYLPFPNQPSPLWGLSRFVGMEVPVVAALLGLGLAHGAVE